MKIVQLTTDNREPFREYEKKVPWFGTAPEALLQGFSQMPEVEVHVISCTQRPMVSPAKLASNIFFHSLHVPKAGWMRTGYLGCIRAARRKIREISPDIVHGQGTERDCALSAVFSGFPNVLTIHGNMRVMARLGRARPFSFYWLAARLEAFVLPRTQGVVCITRYTQAEVAPLQPRTWIVPNAVDASLFDLKLAPTSPPLLLCVGNVSPRKNQNAFIRALDPLAETMKFRVVFLGKADEASEYGREFQQLVDARPWCHFAGFLDPAGLKEWMTTAGAVILPSIEDNCPMVVLEAMAAGLPVAAGRVGGVPELVQHLETGLLFDPLDAADMRESTARLLRGGPEIAAMTARAREEAEARFHPRAIARRHLAIYEEVISNRVAS